MAVFGAPIRLPEKERAAVEAGLAIVRAAIPMPRAPRQGKGPPISVRVGIATGTDYVGEIRAADRVIWSAIGNTTNLAARLQRLTRDLNAAILIDSPTRDGSKAAAAEFQIRRSVPIRGRHDAQDAYMLPTSARSRSAPDRPEAAGIAPTDCIAAMRNFDMSSASVGPALAQPGSP
jgi:class 3 adenylate cyclase